MKLRLSFILFVLLVGIGTFVIMPGIAFAGGAKVDVCHIPPGNPDNFHTIRISEKALDKHMAHGDLAGACNASCAELCDDGDACTIDDIGDCDHGCPVASPVDCFVSLCLTDSCDPAVGCVNEPVCDDGDACTVDACDPGDGSCTAPPVACDAGNECSPGTGQCILSCITETYIGNGHEYTICQGANDRDAAQNYCDAIGSVLSYIDDAEENTWVTNTAFAEFGFISFQLSSYWIANVKGDGGFTNWAAGEPNGDGVYVHVPRYGNDLDGWNDVPESWEWGFVCESLNGD